MRPLVPILFALLVASPARAAEGVLEINQTCTVKTGCFSGDVPGFPVTIDGTAGRSYRLTGDLVVLSALSHGILVSTPDVSIDLGGFTIIGLACVGELNDCTPFSGTGNGISAQISGVDPRGLSVSNGSIVGMGANGVALGDQAQVTDLRVRWNHFVGILTGAGSTISGITAYQNGTLGIVAGAGSTISGNTVYLNGGDGINASFGSMVQRNAVRSNGGYGMALSNDAAYRENVITSNTTGTVAGGVNMFSNSCNGTTICP